VSARPPTVVVIGAGLAGLAAAVRLAAAGHVVRVVDPAPWGGKARTDEPAPGWRTEWGPHSFLHRADAIWTLAAELGVAHTAVKAGAAAGHRYLVRGGRLRKAPFGALSIAAWIGVVRGMFSRAAHVPGESVFDWFARRFGLAFARGPLDAMLTGIWASDPAAIEMDTAFPTIARLVRAHGSVFAAIRAARRAAPSARPAGTYGFPGGMGTLAAAALARLGADALVSAKALAVARAGERYVVTTDTGVLDADAVVIAVEAPAAAALLGAVAPAGVSVIQSVCYAPLAVAHWTAPDAAFPHGFGFLAAHGEGRSVLGTIFVSDVFPDRAPAGMRSFATMFGGARRPEDARVDTLEATRRIEAEHRALTGRAVTIAGLHLVHHPAAVAAPAPGHAARVAAIQAALPPGIAVAGAWCGAGAMDDAVHAGFAAAARLGAPAPAEPARVG